MGEERTAELSRMIGHIMMRRTAEIMRGYLPAKVESIGMCKEKEIKRLHHDTLVYSEPISSLAFMNI